MQSFSFIELPNFTKYLYDYLTEEGYGDVVPGSGGCRKIRWATKGHGKRGGVRIIYYLRRANGQIWMLTIYAKNETENVAPHILRAFKEKIDRAK